MADNDNGPCCGHDHVGGDEQWMTVGEIADVVFDAVESGLDALVALPADATAGERRAAMRTGFDERRAKQDTPKAPATWRERMWSGGRPDAR